MSIYVHTSLFGPLFFCVFQVEVTTTTSYLSIQNIPLRFCIHVSPLYWANPGNYLGAVIGDEIKDRKKKIWKQISCSVYLWGRCKNNVSNHKLTNENYESYYDSAQSNPYTKLSQKLLLERKITYKNIPASFLVLKPQSHDAFHNRCCSLNEVASAFSYGAKIILVTRALPLRSCLFHIACRSPLVQ